MNSSPIRADPTVFSYLAGLTELLNALAYGPKHTCSCQNFASLFHSVHDPHECSATASYMPAKTCRERQAKGLGLVFVLQMLSVLQNEKYRCCGPQIV